MVRVRSTGGGGVRKEQACGGGLWPAAVVCHKRLSTPQTMVFTEMIKVT